MHRPQSYRESQIILGWFSIHANWGYICTAYCFKWDCTFPSIAKKYWDTFHWYGVRPRHSRRLNCNRYCHRNWLRMASKHERVSSNTRTEYTANEQWHLMVSNSRSDIAKKKPKMPDTPQERFRNKNHCRIRLPKWHHAAKVVWWIYCLQKDSQVCRFARRFSVWNENGESSQTFINRRRILQ